MRYFTAYAIKKPELHRFQILFSIATELTFPNQSADTRYYTYFVLLSVNGSEHFLEMALYYNNTKMIALSAI